MDAATNKQVFCLIRRQWIAATPEEMVRQRLLLKLSQQLGFPVAQMAVEVSLRQMPHLNTQALPTSAKRRADILCYSRDILPDRGLYPLLLIECKAVVLNEKVVRQTVGYNRYIKACYIAIANHQEERLGFFDAELGDYRFVTGLPSYQQMLKAINESSKPGPLLP